MVNETVTALVVDERPADELKTARLRSAGYEVIKAPRRAALVTLIDRPDVALVILPNLPIMSRDLAILALSPSGHCSEDAVLSGTESQTLRSEVQAAIEEAEHARRTRRSD